MRSPRSCLWFLVAEQLGSDSLGALGFQGQGDAPSPPAPQDARDSFNAGQHLSFHCRRTGLGFKPPQEKQYTGLNEYQSAND